MVFSDAVVRVKLTSNSEQIYLEYSWHVKTIALSIYHENIKLHYKKIRRVGTTFQRTSYLQLIVHMSDTIYGALSFLPFYIV